MVQRVLLASGVRVASGVRQQPRRSASPGLRAQFVECVQDHIEEVVQVLPVGLKGAPSSGGFLLTSTPWGRVVIKCVEKERGDGGPGACSQPGVTGA